MYISKRGAGRPLVLIHGMFGDHLDWEPVLEPLALDYQVLALDLPGFGRSEKPAVAYDADFFLDALEPVIPAKSILAGNSFGGQIAMLYSLRHPERVSGLVLVDSGGFSDYSAAEREFLKSRLSEDTILRLTPASNRALFTPLFVNQNDAVRNYLEKQEARLGWPDLAAYARSVSRCIALSVETCLLDRLGEIRCPVLLLWGECDPVVPVERARQAALLFPRAQLEIIPRCGHVPQIDRPEAFLESLRRFLSRIPG